MYFFRLRRKQRNERQRPWRRLGKGPFKRRQTIDEEEAETTVCRKTKHSKVPLVRAKMPHSRSPNPRHATRPGARCKRKEDSSEMSNPADNLGISFVIRFEPARSLFFLHRFEKRLPVFQFVPRTSPLETRRDIRETTKKETEDTPFSHKCVSGCCIVS
ncbi:hypothetical protein TGME49_232085 [Toxoplasma gondii ME49]|uniref:Uncharacterized protein n=4 Tax=Toxoplasma gondii TaxID=5811 RepID=A0A125YI21_TOXGV|nr:hypothetical protein TGME49_232085 [Toxoplasma gondii ME49]EPT28888.1 hypothetical protein TGME49_232085 [Toxoplasma gondii ME49]ESS35767.1 hypothetical protein TGVEG_232085 [Toxoplasma gondii VEG]KFH17369.1 hypothetical protein TGMAS_232085 [Toxoplasma gondii MAS]KYF46173.1 hypothetical protein TGARI_232085 [Toxoplasma gondii ARI]|eukprot:XP_018636825.1 hypothetical protein TGME49_232085 [Toxoplasma gondii ME49]